MNIYHISDDSGEVEYIYISESPREQVEEILEAGETITDVIPITDRHSLPLNRKLIAER